MGGYEQGLYKSPNVGYNYSYPTYKPLNLSRVQGFRDLSLRFKARPGRCLKPHRVCVLH